MVRAGASLTVSNPATGETLPVPPLPCARLFIGHIYGELRWDQAYCFAYHPVTGKYKVVHVPWNRDRLFNFQNVQVLTLGDATWREVPAPPGGAMCDLAAGVISIDGVTHWVKVGGATRIVSFDLDAERFASTTTPLPALPDHRLGSYHLTEVHGRLGFVIFPDVWVLEQHGRRWSRRYRLEEHIPRPHFVFGDFILTARVDSSSDRMSVNNKSGLYAHRPKSTPPSGWRLECGGVERVGHRDHATLVARMKRGGYYERHRTFAYVETMEPLSVYAAN
jgi:F-box interacting protein